jgi:hypothetical protein
MGVVGVIAFYSVGAIHLLFCIFLGTTPKIMKSLRPNSASSNLFFGLFPVICGVLGYIKAKSIISLVTSCFFALVFLISGFLLMISYQVL